MLYHYADLVAQGYRPGMLNAMQVLCGDVSKGRMVTCKRARVTCPICIEKVKELPPEAPKPAAKSVSIFNRPATPNTTAPPAPPHTTPITPDQFPAIEPQKLPDAMIEFG